MPSDHVVLVEPEIPWNTGNAGRTCLAAGARLHLVAPLGFSLDEKAVRRSGVDYWEAVDPVVHESFAAFEAALPALGEPLFFSAEAPRTPYETPLPEAAAGARGARGGNTLAAGGLKRGAASRDAAPSVARCGPCARRTPERANATRTDSCAFPSSTRACAPST